MPDLQIRFDDGSAYDRMMGHWSSLAGAQFLEWLAIPPGQRWLDVGCGTGAFTKLVMNQSDPESIMGIDPSQAQLAFARQRVGLPCEFLSGDAMALPFSNAMFDVTAMALVIFFVPDPAKSVSEMARVTRPGGIVTSYAWDIPGGGFPLAPIHEEMRKIGISPLLPPSASASGMSALSALWESEGLEAIECKEFTVVRTFDSFDSFWSTSLLGTSMRATVTATSSKDLALLKKNVRGALQADETGEIKCSAKANAIRGLVRR